METEIVRSAPEYKAHNKRNILIGIGVLSVVTLIAKWLAVSSEAAYGAVSILSTVGFVVGMILWVHADAWERNMRLSRGFKIALILLGIFTLIYYLFKSRGFVAGIIAVGWLFLYIAALFILNAIVNVVLALISDRLGIFAQ
jgi:hypothetical protein